MPRGARRGIGRRSLFCGVALPILPTSAVFRSGFAAATTISLASVPSAAIASAMNWLSGIACSASWLFINSVRTQGGAISSTRTPASFSRKTLRKGVGVERRLGRGIDRRERERHEAQDRTRISNDRIVPLLQMPDERGTHADRPHQVGGDRVD